MQQLRTVRLYGRLGALFGRKFSFALETNTPAEAISALCSQLKGFREYLTSAKDRGVGFMVFVGKRNLNEEDLTSPSGSDDIRIAPVLLGSKNGLGSVILGAVLVVVGAFITGLSYGWAAPVGGAISKVGVGLIVGGVVQMLSPQPKALKNGDRPDNQPSYVFNGAVNTQAQGNPVPVLYGRMIVGSAVVSAGIHAEDYAPATAGVGGGVNLNGRVLKNFYER